MRFAIMNTDNRILGVFAKWPEPGKCKTRLAAETSAEFAVAIADAMLDDTIERWSGYAATRILAVAPPDQLDQFAARAGSNWLVQPQCAGDLGLRIRDFFRTLHSMEPASHVVLIGADSPTLPIDYINQAFAALAAADVVLGPATDGGYYLVGGTAQMPHEMFDGIEYGKSDVLEKTIRRISDTTRVALLPPWHDVDTVDDWQSMCGHLSALRRAGINPMAPRTEARCKMKNESIRT